MHLTPPGIDGKMIADVCVRKMAADIEKAVDGYLLWKNRVGWIPCTEAGIQNRACNFGKSVCVFF